MRYKYAVIWSLLVAFIFITVHQSSAQIRPIRSDKVDPENVYTPLIKKLYLERVQEMRAEKGLDSLMQHKVFSEASEIQAEWMKKNGRASTDQRDNEDMGTTQKRLASLGAKKDADVAEIAAYSSVGRGRRMYTYEKVVNDLLESVLRSRSNKAIIRNPDYVFTGLAITYQKDRKRVYISQTYGAANSLNLGPKYQDDLELPYDDKEYGLAPPLEQKCNDIKRFYDWSRLHEGLFVEENNIYIEYDNLNKLKELLSDEEDGLAVDVVQKAQYPCQKPNIYDKELLHKGILTKPLYKDKFFEFNCIADDKHNRYVGKLGELPDDLEGDYELGTFELNLLIIQDEHVCKTVLRSYSETNKVKGKPPVKFLPDTFIQPGERRFKPKTEHKTLEYKIPFERGKYDYKEEDIEPFIDALDQPGFQIDSIYIIAHSSLEGDSAINAKLQHKRAESIIKALEKYHSENLVQDIKTDDSWELFQKQIRNTQKYSKFRYLADTTKQAAKNIVEDSSVYAQLAPLLAEERFANITIKATIDVTGDAELDYYRRKMKAALDSNDAKLALAMQRYMVGRITKGIYDSDILYEHNFPEDTTYAPLLLNQFWAKNKYNQGNRISEGACNKISDLRDIAPHHTVLKFNDILCEVQHHPLRKEWVDSLQGRIDALYNADDIDHKSVDALNIRFQLRIIDKMDTLDRPSNTVIRSLRKIQNVFKPENAKWQTAMRIANIFSRHKDYDYALKALEPHITDKEKAEKISDDFIFTYISMASHYPEKYSTKPFREAMAMAKQRNESRYCELFGTPFLSIQVLDDPFIKNNYCKVCY